MRTIDANEVQDQDFIFQHSSLGRGYFVIRCERNKDATGVVHRFDTDPLKGDRIIKHFRSANPRPRCHNADQALPRIRKLEAIRRFGYRGRLDLVVSLTQHLGHGSKDSWTHYSGVNSGRHPRRRRQPRVGGAE
jgi:hypothetical protein